MSDVVAQAPKEQSTFSEAIVQDIPNTHLERAPGSIPDTHGKLAGHQPSRSNTARFSVKLIFTPGATASTTANLPNSASYVPTSSPPLIQPDYNPSASTIAVGSEGPQASSSKTPAQGQYLGQGLAPSVPQRLSSNSKLSYDTTTSMPESATTNPTSISKRGSKGSLKPKSRSGSLASSSSKKAVVATDTQNPGESGRKVKRRGRFLSFLNCCSAPEDANEVELGEQAVPAKKVRVLQQKSGRQPTPLVKTSSNSLEASKAEAKKPTDENIGGPEYSEIKSAEKPKMITRSSKDKVSLDKSAVPSGSAGQKPESPEQAPPIITREPPLPPLPPSNIETQQEIETEVPMLPKTAVIAAEPPQMMAPEESVAVQGSTINDRTLKQEIQDSDVAMPDAPPLPTARETPSPNVSQELAQTQMALPPPPPRNGHDRSVPSTANATPNEKQQWLLPPLQSQLKGRKCLVLDLDETLVHSSFKVRMVIMLFVQHLTRLDFT